MMYKQRRSWIICWKSVREKPGERGRKEFGLRAGEDDAKRAQK